MDTTHLCHSLGFYSTRTPGQVNHALHHLVRQGVLPSNGRGRPAAQVGLEHCAAALVALAIAGTPEEAAARVPDWLRMVDRQTGTIAFGEFLAAGCAAFPNGVREIQICTAWPHATVMLDDGDTLEFGFTGEAARSAGYAAAPVRSVLVIPGVALNCLAGGAMPDSNAVPSWPRNPDRRSVGR